MVLRVAFDQFADEVRERLPGAHVYVGLVAGRTVVSAGDPERRFVLYALCNKGNEGARSALAGQGLAVKTGSWLTPGELGDPEDERPDLWVVAVGYRSREPKPGVWMDAYASEPTPAEVLRNAFDEFQSTGELPADVSFEDFLRLAHPNVTMLPPEAARRYADRARD